MESKPLVIREGENSTPLFPALQLVESQGRPTVSKSASEVVEIITRQAKLPKGNGELYEVIIKDEIKDGMKQGKYIWDGTEATIRDAKTKSIKGHIKVKEVSPSTLEKLSCALTSVAGEIQLAQIMAKLDEIQKTVEEVNRKIDVENSSKLFGTVNTIKQVLFIDNHERKLRMLENTVPILNQCADYYLKLYSDQIEVQPERVTAWDMLEGLTEKFGYKPGTEQFLLNTIKELDKATNYFVLYILSMAALVKVYQVLEHYPLSQIAVDSIRENIKAFENQLSDRARFFFNITEFGDNNLDVLLAAIANTHQKFNLDNGLKMLETKIEQNKLVAQRIECPGLVQFEICEGE